MVLGRGMSKCANCPQRYTCGMYMSQMADGANNYLVNNANKIEDQSIIRSVNKSTKESAVNNQEITALFLSIEDNLNKTNQELSRTNQELSNQNAMLRLEMEQIKEEIKGLRSQEESQETQGFDLEDDEEEEKIGQLNIYTDNEQIEGSQTQERGLDLYNKNNSTIFREKKTIFGTKKWVEEKR